MNANSSLRLLCALPLVAAGCTQLVVGTGGGTTTGSGSSHDVEGEASGSASDPTNDNDDTSSATFTSEGAESGSTATGAPSACGNGMLDDGEQCDDGNDVDDDACSNACVGPCGERWSTLLEPGIRGSQGVEPVLAAGLDGGGMRVYGATFRGLAIRFWVGEYDDSAQQLSALEVELPGATESEIWEATTDAAGNLLVIGRLAPVEGGVVRPLVGRYDPSGQQAWTLELDPLFAAPDGHAGIAASAAGDVAISATIEVNDTDTDIGVAVVDGESGAIAWSAAHSGAFEGGYSTDKGGRVAMTADGTVYALGLLRRNFESSDATLVAFAPGGGAAQWATTVIEDTGQYHDQFPARLALDSSGNPVAAVTVVTASDSRATVHAFDPQGTERWSFDIADQPGVEGRYFSRTSLTTAPSGDLIVAGEFLHEGASFPGGLGTWLARLDPDLGEPTCVAQYGAIDDFRTPASLSVLADDTVIIAGGAPPGDSGPSGAPGWLTAFR